MTTAPFAWAHEKTQVQFDGLTLTVNDKHLPLDQIDRLSRNLSRSTAQGSWNRLDCGISLLANGQVSTVRFHGDASTAQWGPWRPLWDQLDEMVHAEIQPRLLQRTISQVTVNGSAEIGSASAKGRGRFVVTAANLQARKMFSKPIAWSSIAEISVAGTLYQIITSDPDGKQRTFQTGLNPAEWDAWQLPLLWRHFTSTPR